MGWKSAPAIDSFRDHEADWDALNNKYADGNPYFDSCFVGPLIECFATKDDHLWVHTTGGAIDGACVLSKQKAGKSALFVPSQVQIAPLLVANDEMLTELVRQVSPTSLAIDVPCQDPLFTPIGVEKASLPVVRQDHAYTICVNVDGTFNDYWTSRSKNLRSSVGRRRKKAEKDGIEVSFVHRTSSSEMTDAVDRFGEMETRSWKGEAGTAVHASNVQGKFYASVMKRFSEKGKASIFELYFNDEVVAIELGILSDRMVVLLKTTFDNQWSKYSPGRLLLHELLNEEFRLKRAPVVEFYTNADGNERSWASEGRWVFNATVFRSSAILGLYNVARGARNALMRRRS